MRVTPRISPDRRDRRLRWAGKTRVTGAAAGSPVIIRDASCAALGYGSAGQGGGYGPRGEEEEHSGQESHQSGLGGRGRLTSCGWQPSTTGDEVTAVSGVRLHEGARPE